MTASEREATILSLKAQVEGVAGTVWARTPHTVLMEDLVSCGWIGAINAVDRYEPNRGVSLKSFAESRIRGAMLDYLRNVDPLSRIHRARVKRGELPNCETMWLEDLPTRCRLKAADNRANFGRSVETKVDCEILARDGLRPMDRVYLTHFFAGITNNYEISRRMNLSVSRACQIFGEIVVRLRDRLGLAG